MNSITWIMPSSNCTILPWHSNGSYKIIKSPPTGACLVVAGGLPNKRKPKQESIYYKRSGEGFIVKNIYCALLPATTSLKMPIVKKTCCVLLPLSFMKNFKMKICCVLLPASLWRRYSCVLLSSSAVYFCQCVYQKLCLRCQVLSWEGLYEWDMLPIKIKKKKKKDRMRSIKKHWSWISLEGQLVQKIDCLIKKDRMSWTWGFCPLPIQLKGTSGFQ